MPNLDIKFTNTADRSHVRFEHMANFKYLVQICRELKMN
eukprot:COSAG01_NODE_90_length_27307_cov_734.166458_32_plen_39_part_00